ncbi:MAG TPA: hypothetical protein VJ455_06365 [Ignavibacteria bacterium]|nr:hypothetical protein [Ignavibacteria bacterium]
MPKATVTQVYKRIEITPNKTDGILNYDIDNAYPQRIEDIVNNSGTASTCVNMKTRFLMGGGFEDELFYKQKINRKGLTVDKLLRKVSANLSKLPFIGLHINYNANYNPIEVTLVPFTFLRLTHENKKHPNTIGIYDNWDKSKRDYNKDKIKYVHLYNPDPEVIQAQVDEAGGWEYYNGQVFLYSPEGLEYPLASFDSVLEDMQTDSKAKSFKFRNITTNFMASHAIITDQCASDEAREAFIESLEDFQGADDSMRMMHLEKTTTESTIEIKKIEIQDVDKLYEFTESSVKNNIIQSFLIPPVLLLQTEGKLGTSSEIKDATAYYNAITYHERLIIEEIFTEIFTNFYPKVNTTGNYSIIPLKAPISEKELTADVFPYVTKNQILTSYGLPEVQEAIGNVKPMYEALGVGGLQALTALLADATLTPIQKQNALIIIFKLSIEDAKRLTETTITV